MSFPQSIRRRRWQAVAALTAASLVAAGIMAIPSPAQATRQPLTGPRVPSHTITLVTGDTVTVTTLADGRQVADVRRPESATGGVRLQQSGGDLYVLPDEALGAADARTSLIVACSM